MAKLRKCKDCGHEVSKRASACPSCGAPVKKRRSSGFLQVLVFGGLTVWIVGAFYDGSASSNPRQDRVETESAASTQNQSNRELFESDPLQSMSWMERDKRRIRAILKDGESARFDGVYISFYGDSPVTCGRVNAKNSFGAYAGYKQFLAAELIDLSVIRGDGQMSDAEFAKTWNKVCLG